MDDNVLIVTNHALLRLRKRLSISKSAAIRMAERAFKCGITHSESTCKKHLNRWMTKQFFWNRTANNLRVYGDKCYIFHDFTLLTVIQVPHNLLESVKELMLAKGLEAEEE